MEEASQIHFVIRCKKSLTTTHVCFMFHTYSPVVVEAPVQVSSSSSSMVKVVCNAREALATTFIVKDPDYATIALGYHAGFHPQSGDYEF